MKRRKYSYFLRMQNDSALKSPIRNHEKFPINTTLENHFVLAISLIKNTALFIRTNFTNYVLYLYYKEKCCEHI